MVYTLSGRIVNDDLEELKRLFQQESAQRSMVLNLKEVKLVDREAVRFLESSERDGMRLDYCPAYVREWITKEREQQAAGSESEDSAGGHCG